MNSRLNAIKRHVESRYAERVNKQLNDKLWQSLNDAAGTRGLVERRKTQHVDIRYVKFKSRLLVVVYDRSIKQVLTCWKAGRREHKRFEASRMIQQAGDA